MNVSNIFYYKWSMGVAVVALASTLMLAVRINEQSIKQEKDLEINDWRLVSLKAIIVKREQTATLSHKSEAIAYVKRKSEISKGMEIFQSKIIVRTYAGKQISETNYELQLNKEFSEYAFGPILAPNSQLVFFRYGIKEGGSEFVPDAYCLYVLYLKTGNVMKISPEFISDNPTPVTDDGRYIAYMIRNQLTVFDAVTKTNISVASSAGLHAKYSWKQGEFPSLYYSISKNGKTEQHRRVFKN